jgi:hypothetical protein
MVHCVADFSQKLLAYVIVQNYTPGGVGSNFFDNRQLGLSSEN